MESYEKQLASEGLIDDREGMEGDALDKLGMQNMKFNIVFTMDENDEELSDSESETDSKEDTE